MVPQTYIFIGRSGCGKGTQAKLLEKYLSENDDEKRQLFYLEMGSGFRNFWKSDGHSNKLSTEIYEKGGLQPGFIAVWIWAQKMIENLDGKKHLIVDGIARRVEEAKMLTSALKFYGRINPKIIFMNVSRDWGEQRLRERGRADDRSEDEIDKRMEWFEKDTTKSLDYLKNEDYYDFLDINGEQTIEEVYKEIISKI